MKIQEKKELQCTVNGAVLSVPYGVKFISIDMNGRVEYWTELPYLSEGFWTHDRTRSIRAYQVQLEDGDTWTKLYSVDNHAFIDTYYE